MLVYQSPQRVESSLSISAFSAKMKSLADFLDWVFRQSNIIIDLSPRYFYLGAKKKRKELPIKFTECAFREKNGFFQSCNLVGRFSKKALANKRATMDISFDK